MYHKNKSPNENALEALRVAATMITDPKEFYSEVEIEIHKLEQDDPLAAEILKKWLNRE